GTEDPGTEDPGTEDPGTENPGTGVTPVELTWDSPTIRWVDVDEWQYLVPVSGTPGADVEVWMDGVLTDANKLTLDDQGFGTADLRASLLQYLRNAQVGFRYVIDGVPGEWRTTQLQSLGHLISVT